METKKDTPRKAQTARKSRDARTARAKPIDGAGSRFQVKRARFTRTYEITDFRRIGEDTFAVDAKPVFKDGTTLKGRARTVGYLHLEEAI